MVMDGRFHNTQIEFVIEYHEKQMEVIQLHKHLVNEVNKTYVSDFLV